MQKEKPVWSKGKYVFVVMALIAFGTAWSAVWGYLGNMYSNYQFLVGFMPLGYWLIGLGVGLALARSVKVEDVD